MRATTFFAFTAAAVLAAASQQALRTSYSSTRDALQAERFASESDRSMSQASLEELANAYGLHLIDGQFYAVDRGVYDDARAKMAEMKRKARALMDDIGTWGKAKWASIKSKLRGEDADFVDGVDDGLASLGATADERDAADQILAKAEELAKDHVLIFKGLEAATALEGKLDAFGTGQSLSGVYSSFCKYEVCLMEPNEENCKDIEPFSSFIAELASIKAGKQTWRSDVRAFAVESGMWLIFKVVNAFVSFVMGAIRKIPLVGGSIADWIVARNFHCQAMIANTKYSTECFANEIRKTIVMWTRIFGAVNNSPWGRKISFIKRAIADLPAADKPDGSTSSITALTKCMIDKAEAAGRAQCAPAQQYGSYGNTASQQYAGYGNTASQQRNYGYRY